MIRRVNQIQNYRVNILNYQQDGDEAMQGKRNVVQFRALFDKEQSPDTAVHRAAGADSAPKPKQLIPPTPTRQSVSKSFSKTSDTLASRTTLTTTRGMNTPDTARKNQATGAVAGVR